MVNSLNTKQQWKIFVLRKKIFQCSRFSLYFENVKTHIIGQRIINNKWPKKKHLYRTGVEGLVIEVAAVCKGNSEKVCTGDFGQEIERIKLLQRKFYFLKEASMFWDYHFFQRSVPPPSRFSLISNVWWPACLPSLQAQISSKSLSFKRRHS